MRSIDFCSGEEAIILRETKYRRDIQVLRGLAVLAVLLFHAKEISFPLGYLGVDVFFVISGFVVTPLILRIFADQANVSVRLNNLKVFYKRRFYRLAPALAAVLTISIVIILLLGPVSDHQKIAQLGISTLLLVGNFGAYKYSGDYFDVSPNPLIHTWSLSVEEQIYIFLPLILILIIYNRGNVKKLSLITFGSITLISFISFLFPSSLEPIYSRIGIDLPSRISFYSPLDRIWQFTLGGLGYFFLSRYQRQIRIFPRITNLILVISLFLLLFGPIYINLKLSSILASFVTLFLILLRSLDSLPKYFTNVLEWVGDRSYSIYLVHMPLIYIAKYSPLVVLGNGENRKIQSVIAIILSITLGALLSTKIENRFRNIGKTESIGVKSMGLAILATFVLPLILFVGVDTAFKNSYWGLDKNVPQPTYAADLDPTCGRTSVFGPPCTYINSGATKTVLLLGDSHAGHLSQAFVDVARKENWNAIVWAHGGCHVQFQQSIKFPASRLCMDRNEAFLKWVKTKKLDAIIVSEFVHSESSQRDLRNGLTTLQLIAPKILLIENTPVFPDTKDFMVSRALFMSPYVPPKSFPQSAMQFNDKSASNQLGKWARKNNVSTLNFESLFCKDEICTRYADSKWLYLDVDHLSVAGAKLAIPQLTAYLRGLSLSGPN